MYDEPRIASNSSERPKLLDRRKRDKDRAVPLAESLVPSLNLQLAWRPEFHARDVEAGVARVELPFAFERKSPTAASDLAWWFVFCIG